MRVARLSPSLLAVLALAAPALAQEEPVQTPLGPTRVEGEAFSEEGLRLFVGDRELLRSTDDMALWAEAVVGDLLLVGLASGGTACEALWQWVDVRSGAASERFGTCSGAAEVTVAENGTVVVSMPGWDLDHPTSDFLYDGVAIVEVPGGQEPAELPPGTAGDAWVGHYGWELFMASDWRGPLVALLGEEAYDQGQAAFTTATPMGVEGDWVVGTGCVKHACDILEGAVAVHRKDGRVLVALSEEGEHGYRSWVWGDGGDPLPPTVAAMLDDDETAP